MCSVYTSCHSNHQPRHTKQHECDWTAGRRLWSGLMHTKSGQAVVMALTRTHTLGENMHKRLKLQKKKTWFLSKAHTTRTIVKEDWQASMHMKKEGIMELNGKENGCGKPTQYFRGTTASKSFLGKKKKKTYSFWFGLDHFHERPPRSCLHQFRFGYFPGVQKLQLGQLVKNKVPVRHGRQKKSQFGGWFHTKTEILGKKMTNHPNTNSNM